MFSLLTDPWIHIRSHDRYQIASLNDLLENASDIHDIEENPIVRLAILRLLLSLHLSPPSTDANFELFGEEAFLQIDDLDADGKPARMITLMEDANNIAWTPENLAADFSYATTAKGLVTAFFCDRGGQKTHYGNLKSAQLPLYMGKLIRFHWRKTLADFLSLNSADIGTSSFVPWWERPIEFDEPWDGSLLHYLLWPWRRLKVPRPGYVIVAPGAKFTAEFQEPWVVKTAQIKDFNSTESEFDADFTGIVLKQATPLAAHHWFTPGTPVANDKKSEDNVNHAS